MIFAGIEFFFSHFPCFPEPVGTLSSSIIDVKIITTIFFLEKVQFLFCFYSSFVGGSKILPGKNHQIEMSQAMRKCVLCHMRTTKAQISLRIRAV